MKTEDRRWANFYTEVHLNDTMIEVEKQERFYHKVKWFVVGTIILLAGAVVSVWYGLFDKFL